MPNENDITTPSKLFAFRAPIWLLCFGLAAFALGAVDSAGAQVAGAIAKEEAGSSNIRYVEVRSSKIRKTPEHWGTSLAELKYGDKVTLLEEQADWLLVQSDKAEGFIHKTAVTVSPVVFRSASLGSAGIEADRSDIVLAGKGFNAECEASYMTSGALTDYAALERLEQRIVITDTELESFISQGGLKHAS